MPLAATRSLLKRHGTSWSEVSPSYHFSPMTITIKPTGADDCRWLSDSCETRNELRKPRYIIEETSFIDHFSPYTTRRHQSAGPFSSAPSSRVSSIYQRCYDPSIVWNQISENRIEYDLYALSVDNQSWERVFGLFSATIRDAQAQRTHQESRRFSFESHIFQRNASGFLGVTSKNHNMVCNIESTPQFSSWLRLDYEKDLTRCLDSPARRRKNDSPRLGHWRKSNWRFEIFGSQDSVERNTEWTTSLNLHSLRYTLQPVIRIWLLRLSELELWILATVNFGEAGTNPPPPMLMKTRNRTMRLNSHATFSRRLLLTTCSSATSSR